MDDFRGELRELRDEDCGEPRAVGALVGDEAAGRRDRGEVLRARRRASISQALAASIRGWWGSNLSSPSESASGLKAIGQKLE